MQARIAAVHPGGPTMVDTVMAGVSMQAEWVGTVPSAGELVDVELDVDAVLEWADTIAIDGAEATLREGPLLRGTVETQEQEILTVRVAEGLLEVEVDDGSVDVPPGTAVAVVAEHLRLYPTGV
jgi:hypothetical protein